MVMGFGKSRFKRGELELHRMCSLINTTVIGGACKLFKRAATIIEGDIISYCDLRLFDGNVYTKMGFDYQYTTPPGYHYFSKNSNLLLSRFKFQKHKLPAILADFNCNSTEYHNMVSHGFDRVFDCGNSVYKYHADKQKYIIKNSQEGNL